MPGAIEGAASSGKRKRSSKEKGPSKRARSESSEEDGQAQILLLETAIFESKKNYNNIATLLKLLRSEDDDGDNSVLAAISLCRVFTRLMVSGAISKKEDTTEKEIVVIDWLNERYTEFKSELLALLGEEEIASTALTLCMRLLKTEGQHLHSVGIFPRVFLRGILTVFLDPECGSSVRQEFSQKFVEEYDDIRYYTFEALEKILSKGELECPPELLFDNVFEILTAVESVPESKEELEDFYVKAPKKKTGDLFSLTQHKNRAQGAWLALMKLEMSKDQRRSVLKRMADFIAPWFMKPELLMDFLTDCYDSGGSTSLLALSGVFYLMQEKNLDYPSFYRKFYSLLDSEILHSKHRSRFLRLLDTFLGSTHLPAALVASFIKRLSRLALNAPPAGIVTIVPWIYNILKKHPTCTFMIHRVTRDLIEKQRIESEGMEDPFLMDEEEPTETKAIDSCLWELVMLQSHYHPNVATLAKIISEQFTKNAYNLEDFLDHSYGSMLEAEMLKDVKKLLVIEFEIPKKIFTKQEAGAEIEDSLLVKLWDFN